MAALTAGASLEHGAPRTTQLRDLTLIEQTDFYALPGRTRAEIADGLRQHGILLSDGKDYRGAYVWQLSWSYRFEPDGRLACRPAAVDVKLSSITALPRWTAPAGAEPGLAADWAKFESALRAHEWRHRNLTVSGAQQLRGKLMKLTASNCDSLKRGLDYVAQGWLEDLRQRNDDYDAATHHGATESVRWPPPAPGAPPR